MPIKITLLIRDNGNRCDTDFIGESFECTLREKHLALAVKAAVDPLLIAEGCKKSFLAEYDIKAVNE